MTSEGVDGLWVSALQEIDQSKFYVSIHSKIKNINTKQGIHNLPFKISLEFELKSIHLYSGEIYNRPAGDFDYKINDEMILSFNDENEAVIFENLINFG